MTRLCIFDLDGTILDTLSAIAHFGNTALLNCGFPAVDESNYRYFAGDGRIILVHRMLKFLDADTPENYEKVSTVYDFEYEKDPDFNTKPFDEIPELLKTLKSMGIKLAVLSNKPDNVAQDVVKSFFGDTFDFVQGAVNNVRSKPEPDATLKICESFGISPQETLFVGDTNVDIKTGKNAKIPACGVLWGFRDKEELVACGADFIVENPMEIAKIVQNEK